MWTSLLLRKAAISGSTSLGVAVCTKGYAPLFATLTVTLLAAALGVWVSVGVSGGHINPAVRLHSAAGCRRTDEPRSNL